MVIYDQEKNTNYTNTDSTDKNRQFMTIQVKKLQT